MMIFLASHKMVFRIPTQFDSFVGSSSHPSMQAPQGPSMPGRTRPWRGSLVVSGLRNSNRSAVDYIQVSAVETDGDKVELWPREFVLHRLQSPVWHQVMQYVQQYTQPTCNFIPERLHPDFTEANRAAFRMLSRSLHENHEVVIASWGPQSQLSATGAGIIIYPAANSGAYLIGAIFHSTDFPDFIKQSSIAPDIQTQSFQSFPQSMPYMSHEMGHHHPSASYGQQQPLDIVTQDSNGGAVLHGTPYPNNLTSAGGYAATFQPRNYL